MPYKVCCGSKSKSSKETEKPTKERESNPEEHGKCCTKEDTRVFSDGKNPPSIETYQHMHCVFLNCTFWNRKLKQSKTAKVKELRTIKKKWKKYLPTYTLRIMKRRDLVGLKFIFNTINDSSKSKTGMAKIYLAQKYCARIKRNKWTAEENLIPILENQRMSFVKSFCRIICA